MEAVTIITIMAIIKVETITDLTVMEEAIIEAIIITNTMNTCNDGSQFEQYGPPCALCSGFNHSPKHCFKGEHDINILMEKMSLGSSNQHQNGLYQ